MKFKTAGFLVGVWIAYVLLTVLIAKLMDMSHPDNPYNLAFGAVAAVFVFVVAAMIWTKLGPALEPVFERRRARKSEQQLSDE